MTTCPTNPTPELESERGEETPTGKKRKPDEPPTGKKMKLDEPPTGKKRKPDDRPANGKKLARLPALSERFLPTCSLPISEWNVVKPKGLVVMDTPLPRSEYLWDFYHSDEVEWFQRFGLQYPKTAHWNGHHTMASKHPVVLAAVQDAIRIAQDQCSHPALKDMLENIDDVSVATMRHMGAVREPSKRKDGTTKLRTPGWGLGRHPDTYAPQGQGLVLMICVAKTEIHHREFQFTCPPLGQKYALPTPNGTILVFCDEAYEMWEHESIRSKFQDGECISLTIRKRKIDAYYGWQGGPEDQGEMPAGKDDPSGGDDTSLPSAGKEDAVQRGACSLTTSSPSSSISVLDAMAQSLSEHKRNSVGFARFAQHYLLSKAHPDVFAPLA